MESLNNFEYFAVGVKLGIFDRQVIKELYIGIFVKFYMVFSEYILHFNYMYSDGANGIWSNFAALAREFIEEYDDFKEEVADMLEESSF